MSFATYIIMYYKKSDKLICELHWQSYLLQAQKTFLFITFAMQDLFSPFLIISVAQLQLNFYMLLTATAVVLNVYCTKMYFILEPSSWTQTMGETSEV